MTSCTDLDPFFDGELPKETAAGFRSHLAGCERCQVALCGRMQEEAIIDEGSERGAPYHATGAVEPPTDLPRPQGVRVTHRPAHRARRHLIAYLAPILAVAAAVAIWLVTTRGDRPATTPARLAVAGLPSSPVEVALTIEPRGVATRSGAGSAGEARGSVATRSGADTAGETRGSVAQVGDVLRSTVRGEDHRAIWVYLEDRELVTSCPDGPECSNAGGSLTLELRLAAPGRYSVIAISSAQPILMPHGQLDMMLGSIAAVGAHFEIKHVDVN